MFHVIMCEKTKALCLFFILLLYLQYVQPVKCFIMRKVFILLIVSCFCMMGCKMNPQEESKAINSMTAKEIVEKNYYIDEDPRPESRATNIGYWTSTRRAAHYRFFKAMTFDEDGIVIKMPTSGAELNISEELFQEMRWPFEDMMESAKAHRAAGENIRMPDWEEYMNSLLEEKE